MNKINSINIFVSTIKKKLLIFFIIQLFIVNFYSVLYAQTITSNQTSTVNAEAGDFIINSGVTISSGGTPAVNVTGVNVPNFTNNGTITAGNNSALNFTSLSSGAAITNNGSMSGKDTIKILSRSAITNSSTGSITATSTAISFLSSSAGSTLVLNNTLSSSGHGLYFSSSGTIPSITIASGATITANYGITIKSGSTITLLTNNGTIAGGWFGIGMEGGAITTLKNLGTITSSSSRAQIYGGYSATITNFTNSQKDLEYGDSLPTNYTTLISSSSSYGSIIHYSGTAGSTAFTIDATSSVTNNTRYSSMFSNLTLSNISDATETGTFGGLSWALEENCSGGLDLVVGSVTSLVCPELSSSSPADDATNVALDANIVLNFNKSVVRQSGNITIKKTSDNSTVETISVADTDKVSGSGSSQITINPSSNFDASTGYYVLIASTAFDDTDGGSYAGITSTTALSFTSSSNVLPTLSSSTPADDATNVALDANIVLNFSENVTAQSGNITIYKTNGTTVEAISVADTDKVSGSGSSQITINPSSNFDANTGYYVLIASTAFDDVSGGSYAGISSTTALTFTSFPNVLPTLSSSTPADDATNVARDANIVLNFSENVIVQTGNITIKKTTDNTIFETIDVAGSKVTGTGTSQITINPSSNFEAETGYYVLIASTAFDDTGSGSYAGISSTTALSFSVESMVDPTTDKDTTGSIDAQSSQIQSTFIKSISTVSTRLSYLRQNRSRDNFAKNNIKLERDNVMLTSLVKAISSSSTASPKLNLTKLIPDNWSPWSEGSISLSKIGKNSSEIESQSLAFGFDRKLNNNNLLGFAIQYGQSDTDVGTNGTGIDSKNYNLSLYQTRPLNDDNFIEGLIGVGIIEKDLTRKSGSNTLTGSRDGAQIFGSINYGKTIDKGDFNLTPIARVDLGYTELDAYTETGTDALSYDKQTVESGMVSLGLEFNNIIKFSNSSFKPFGLVEYGLDFSNSSDVKMNYVSDTSTTYTYTQSVNSTHLLTSEVGFNYEALENLNIKTSYKRIQGNENEHIDTVKFAFKFKSRRETEYAMSLDGNEDLKTGFDITKNINGLNLSFNANQSFNETFDREAKVSLSSVF